MDHSSHGSHEDAYHDEIACELQLHFRKQYPQEANIETFSMQECFESADVLDSIRAVKYL